MMMMMMMKKGGQDRRIPNVVGNRRNGEKLHNIA